MRTDRDIHTTTGTATAASRIVTRPDATIDREEASACPNGIRSTVEPNATASAAACLTRDARRSVRDHVAVEIERPREGDLNRAAASSTLLTGDIGIVAAAGTELGRLGIRAVCRTAEDACRGYAAIRTVRAAACSCTVHALARPF